MTQQDYEKAKAACWDAFWKENFKGHPVPPTLSIGEVFDYAFAKGNEVGEQKKAAEENVISGWVARDADGDMFLYQNEPDRTEIVWYGYMMHSLPIDSFPDLTWSDDPEPVEIILKRKKKNL